MNLIIAYVAFLIFGMAVFTEAKAIVQLIDHINYMRLTDKKLRIYIGNLGKRFKKHDKGVSTHGF